MFRQELGHDDLKSEIYQLKKQNFNIQSENNILKVKVRRLREECMKKDKQIYALLDPQKNIQVRKVVTDRGAHMLINLKQKNDKLERVILEKDTVIRKLQSKLATISSYFDPQKRLAGNNSIPRCQTDIALLDNRLNVKIPQVSDDQKSDKGSSDLSSIIGKKDEMKNRDELVQKIVIPRTPDFSVISTTLLREVKQLRKGLHKHESGDNNNKLRRVASPMLGVYSTSPIDHLLTLMEEATAETPPAGCGRRGGGVAEVSASSSLLGAPAGARSPASDLDRAELLCETPHEEIQQLQQYFFGMLAEVDELKIVIEKLQQDQQRTDAVLRTKDCSIRKLAEEVKTLKSKRAHTPSILGKSAKAKAYASPKGHTAVKKHVVSKHNLRSTSKTTVSKSSVTCTSEEESVECPFYGKPAHVRVTSKARVGRTEAREGRGKGRPPLPALAQPEVTRLWARSCLNSSRGGEDEPGRMPMIEETATPRAEGTGSGSPASSVASALVEADNVEVEEKEEKKAAEKPCKKAESL